MNKFKFLLYFFIAAGVALTITSCKDDDPTPALEAITYKNLAADPPSGGYNPTNGQPIGVTGKFTLFSFSTGAIVADADLATTKWDIGFNGTGIIINSGTSGPGTASALVQSGIFDEITTAPDTGYLKDNKDASPAFYAITRGSGNGWYSYNQSTNVISPIAGRVIIVNTADGKYAKMEILSYYKDAPATVTSNSTDRYYTFRYIVQPDGTKNFK